MKNTVRKALKPAAIVLGLAAASWLGLAMTGCHKSANEPPAHEEQAPQFYTCPMHPEIRQAKPGKCPICGMDLVPAAQGAETNRTERQP